MRWWSVNWRTRTRNLIIVQRNSLFRIQLLEIIFDRARSKKKLLFSFELFAFPLFSLLLTFFVHVFVYLFEYSHSRWFCDFSITFLLLFFLPFLSLLLLEFHLFLMNLLQLTESGTKPLIPSVEWDFKSLYLLQKFLGVDLVNIFCFIFLSMNHFVSENS